MMPTSQSPKSAGRRARKSIAHVPSITDADRENNTVQGISEKTRAQNAKSKKTRSKSLGPGGLDALIETDGNRQKVSSLFLLHRVDLNSTNLGGAIHQVHTEANNPHLSS